MDNEIKNAKIESVSITMEDHGCLTFWVTVKGAGWGCGIGGFCIGHGYLGAEKFSGLARGLEAMMWIMDAVGVSRWEDLPGHYCRVRGFGTGRSITEIGNILEDKWVDIREVFMEKSEDENLQT